MPETDPPAPESTLAIVNARVRTGDPRRPWADAVLVRGDRVVGVGSSAEIRKRAGAGTRVVDAKGAIVVHGAPAGRIAVGSPADLLVLDRPPDAADEPPATERILLALERGIVVLDRA